MDERNQGAKGRARGSSLSHGRDRFVVFRIKHSYAFYAGAGDKRQILIRIQRAWNLSFGEKSICATWLLGVTEFATQFFFFSLLFQDLDCKFGSLLQL